jgi:hypothetical protein
MTPSAAPPSLIKHRVPKSGLSLVAVVGLMASCQQDPMRDPTELDGPLLGHREETRFYVQPEDGQMRLRDVVVIAKVLRKHRSLEAAERELIRRAAQLQFSGLVGLEIRRLEPKYAPLKAAARKSLPPAIAARRVAELEAEQEREALRNIAAKMGHSFAIPVSSAANKSLMAFASGSNGKLEVADALYEVDVSVASLPVGSGVADARSQVATVIGPEPVNIGATPLRPD